MALIQLTNTLSASLSETDASRDTSTKDSGGHEQILEGLQSGQITVEGYVNTDDDNNYELIYDGYKNRTIVGWEFSDGVNDYTGNALVTQLDRSAGKEESNTYSATLKIINYT